MTLRSALHGGTALISAAILAAMPADIRATSLPTGFVPRPNQTTGALGMQDRTRQWTSIRTVKPVASLFTLQGFGTLASLIPPTDTPTALTAPLKSSKGKIATTSHADAATAAMAVIAHMAERPNASAVVAQTTASAASPQASVALNLLTAGLVCDGVTDSRAVLNRLLAAANSQGKVAYLPATLKPCMVSPGVVVPSGMEVFGDGPGSMLQLLSSSSAGSLLTLRTGARLDFMAIDGNVGNNLTATDLVNLSGGNTVNAVTMQSSRGRCLVATGADDTISFSKMSGCYQQTAQWFSATHLRFFFDYFLCCGGPKDAAPTRGSSNILFKGGISRGNYNGIELTSDLTNGFLDASKYYSSEVYIEGILIQNSRFYGIITVAPDTHILHSTILNNGTPSTLTNTGYQAIVSQGDGTVINDNLIDGAGGDGIDFGGALWCIASNNKIRNVNTIPIELNSTKYCNVQYNQIENGWLGSPYAGEKNGGIVLSQDSGTILPARRLTAIGNDVHNNTVFPPTNASSAMREGVQIIDDGTGSKVGANLVSGNIATGFGAGLGVVNPSPLVRAAGNVTDDTIAVFSTGLSQSLALTVRQSR